MELTDTTEFITLLADAVGNNINVQANGVSGLNKFNY